MKEKDVKKLTEERLAKDKASEENTIERLSVYKRDRRGLPGRFKEAAPLYGAQPTWKRVLPW